MKILLVEDAKAVAALMAARLSAFGYDVQLAENGQVAVEMYQAAPPDLVLMDIEMPVMNGFEATNRIRAFESTQQWAWTPIIFLTASDTPENIVTAIEAGGDDFLAKTVPETVLQAKMKALSRIALLRARLALANRKLEEMANRDGLTGLFNRRHMDLRTDVAWEEAIRSGHAFGLLMLDVDNFKKYNDHYGHQAGDDCLRSVAAALSEVCDELGPDVILARYGGEEFALVLPGIDAASCQTIGQVLVEAVRHRQIPHERNAAWGVVTISVGGAWQNSATGKIVSLFRQADVALYRAKEAGRNQLAFD
ncbi:diguanylate cyclase [Dechloromonas denitrificans]|uniref:diguanylate cyclase domain-containing protein n=1 Tax=Dechloromonas denitrificans TaxID=281362 RepID=UPI001CF8A4CA|nr:diguanylate cyclase [Dechloromonas denitrificans]UCV11978.1 diguanylate cyclase [Dechloromonas denitrificans]